MATLAGAAIATCFVPQDVRAEPSLGLPPPIVAKPPVSHWEKATPRWFAAGYADAGILFARPALELGWGKPHWQWTGVEGYAISTNSFFATYAGARASLPFLDFTLGVRDTWSYVRGFLPPQRAYDDRDLDRASDSQPRARYLTMDAELTGVVPALHGYVLWGFLAARTLDVPANVDVYEEALRVVVDPPFVADFRVGYVVAIGQEETAKIGLLTETLVIPGRHRTVLRAGPAAMVALSTHVDALFVFTTVLDGPDSLGLWDGTYGFAGVRYRWATGE